MHYRSSTIARAHDTLADAAAGWQSLGPKMASLRACALQDGTAHQLRLGRRAEATTNLTIFARAEALSSELPRGR
jgi:hypothetical protein